MYSREESKKIRQEFWINFGKTYQRKWILYNTKIKDFSLKFDFTKRYAEVAIEITSTDEVFRKYYFEKLKSLNAVLKEDYIPEIEYAEDYELDNGKVISRIYIRKEGINVHNRNDWPQTQQFLNKNMALLEEFFLEYKDFIDQ
ncbi:hypothetical protein GCM10007103_34340 [Salinimicrobium marinum]|uniref:DUF4268 domain-containing protein n=1 Tax=Salinimicrobium marinum TaxID=680283 RepID=A0A918SM14_9FLAO|nr:DUF4268 domain-containing protein [Salinimicrobium marinum]GHA50652.1 hypothetical protein GCM10007103_34340 [Salinimicrobium marinum]